MKIGDLSAKVKGVTGIILLMNVLIFAIFGFGIVISKWSFDELGENASIMSQLQVPQIQKANEIKTQILLQQAYVNRYIHHEEPLKAKHNFRESERKVLESLNYFGTLNLNSEISKQIQKVHEEYNDFIQVVNTLFKLDPGRTDLTVVLQENYQLSAENVNRITDDLVVDAMGNISDLTVETNDLIDSAWLNLLLISIAAIIIGLGATGILSIWISRPIRQLVKSMAAIENGDLSQEIPQYKISEFAVLGSSFNNMVKKIEYLVRRITQASHEVSESGKHLLYSAAKVNQATQQLAAGMAVVVTNGEMQKSNMISTTEVVSEISLSVGEMAARAQQQAANIEFSSQQVAGIAELAESVKGKAYILNQISLDISSRAETGKEAVSEAIEGMVSIKEKVVRSSEVIHGLIQHSTEIGNMVQLIADIAEQTNLLALNASIEAARAGEAGKGFAVIASQVRELADNSRNSAKDVENMVKAVRNGIDEAVASMDQITVETNTGSSLVNSASSVLKEIIGEIERTLPPIQEISSMINSVSNKTSDVVEKINQVADLAQNNAAACQEAASQTVTINKTFIYMKDALEANQVATAEVGKHTEEISVSTHEEVGAAQQLAQTAEELKTLIAQFRIEERGDKE